MGKRLFSGDSTPLPDNLRCRRSDGRQWRCSQPAKPGFSFCEHHYQQVRRNQDNIKNTNVAAASAAESERRPLLMADPPPLSKKRRRRQMRKYPSASEPVMSEKMEELNVERELSDLKSNSDLFMPVKFRHEQANGREWQCSKTPKAFLNICDRRQIRCKQPNEENNKAIEPKPKQIPRLAVDLMPSIKRRRQGRLKGETRAEDLARAELNLCDKDLLCCKEDSRTNDVEEQTEEEEEAAEPSTPPVEPSIRRPSIKEHSLPDHLRCRRSDGRKWRCPQLSMPSVGFCEYHYLQLRRNQRKRKNTKSERKLRRKRLKGKVTMRIVREERDDGMEAANVEVTRDLPNGVMAILPAPVRCPANASPWFHWKIGSDDGRLFSRRFRSKNAELVPLGKKLPFVRSVVDRRKKVCHRCRGGEKKGECMIRCLNCQEFFCTTCIETWHSELSELEIKMSCPLCRRCCTCINCNSRRDENGGSQVAYCRDISHS